jgi:hypothetical protein
MPRQATPPALKKWRAAALAELCLAAKEYDYAARTPRAAAFLERLAAAAEEWNLADTWDATLDLPPGIRERFGNE